jgi:hypothetical protein
MRKVQACGHVTEAHGFCFASDPPKSPALQDDPVARRAISSHAAPRQNNIKAYDVQRAKDATSLDSSLLFPSSSFAGAGEH